MSAGINVIVLVPPTIRAAVEGRHRLELGVPATAGVGDLLQSLLTLYPRLRPLLASDRQGGPPGLHLLLAEQALRDLSRRRPGLTDGTQVLLSSPPARRPGGARG